MHCPRCGHHQVCPCEVCHGYAFKNDKDYEPWIWLEDDIKCSKCGLTRHVDWWTQLTSEINK